MAPKKRKKKEDVPDDCMGELVPDSQEVEELSQEMQAMEATPVKKTAGKRKLVKRSKKVNESSEPAQKRTQAKKTARTKSQGTLKEEVFKVGKGYYSVPCKLKTVCPDPDLRAEIRRTAVVMKQVQLEAWHLVNLHTLRCLENSIALPKYDQTFFDHVCVGVAPTSHSHKIAAKNPELWETIKIYRQERKQASCAAIPNLPGLSNSKLELRVQMVVNAGVMLREHFRKRLVLFVQVEYDKNKKQAGKIVDECYHTRAPEFPETPEVRKILVKDEGAWREKWIPWPNRITMNDRIEFYIQLLWRIQKRVERHMTEFQNEKGVRAFSLFPVSTSFSAAHVKINGTTLAGFCKRIVAEKGLYMTERWGLSIPQQIAAFQQNRWTVMRKAFSVDKFETQRLDSSIDKDIFKVLNVEAKYDHGSHLFANQITSDGYDASVLLFRPLTAEEQALQEERAEKFPPKEKKKPKPKTDDPTFPPKFEPEVLIGLDPGMRSVATAVREDSRPARVRRRARRGQRRKRKSKRGIISARAKDYRHLAGFRHHRAWIEGMKDRHPRYGEVVRAMPSFKTGSYARYLERLGYFWIHLHFLLGFCKEKPFSNGSLRTSTAPAWR